ncbi:Tetratricopeptide repeat-containing protein [Chryseolinea serpens]|uniref:Tetratricopeptide repeat-containing protein n=1 Tax=Chryseolinea serpens TaxID=947013 RepID=A0A1M5P608_9BACT|nr:tetratricopeptide repeat protein [Chryseolinea serpens]SHG97155.1 Tetratricopeptide repeat-containing protein [Chryseolinea serpens]
MFDDVRLSKVNILIQQKKFAEAEKILKDSLAQDANNIHLLSLLAECNLQQDNLDAATTIINQAIGLSPDTPHLFYIKSRISIQQQNYPAAEENGKQAVALDPGDADYHALLANIKLARKRYQEALELANKALELDAENLLALNTRSTALLKLNKPDEAFATIEGALREQPNNPYTHANYGWSLLEKGNHKKALEHFAEALKHDPTFGYARAGMAEALKASNPVYKLFLKYAFFMGNLTSKYQWGVLIGFSIGVRALRNIARSNEGLQPYLVPIIIVLSLMAFSTWVITPISNLFLRFNRYGQLLLEDNEKTSANFVATSLALCIAGLLLYGVLSDEKFLAIAAFGLAMMVPLSVMFSPSKHKYALLIGTLLLTGLGLSAIGLTFSTGQLFNIMTPIFLFGFVAFQWVTNYFLIKEDNR